MHPSNYGQLGRRAGRLSTDVSSTNSTSHLITSGRSNESNGSKYDHVSNPSQSSITVLQNHTRKRTVTEDRMKKTLRYFFMNPIEKWRCKRRFPWKLVVQILKILIVTTQVSMFASQRYSHVSYLWNTKVSFSHLFIKNWDPSMETESYPPSSGPLALYKINDFYDSIDYAISMFSEMENTTLGTYKFAKKNGHILMPQFCYSEYKKGEINLDNMTYVVDKEIIQNCIDIPSSIFTTDSHWSVESYLDNLGRNINFDLLLDVKLSLWLRTVRLTLELPFQSPECYQLEHVIYYNNRNHDGQMVIESNVEATVLRCKGFVSAIKESDQSNQVRNVFNVITLCACVISLIMCIRSLVRAHELRVASNKFFNNYMGRPLTHKEILEFVNFWYILICISDFLIIAGTVAKMMLERKENAGFLDKWTCCALLLGIGNLLVWFGCLRYLGFFDTYNMLILTLKSCFPSVIRFSVCMILVFAGYSLCGWLVLGPYNVKFRSFHLTVECLFALINGDDMFTTFASSSGKDGLIWWFSRIYLYSFISLFIYVILSLFIAIIMDSYDTIKRYYKEGFPVSGLKQFAFAFDDDEFCEGYWDDQERTIHDIVNSCLCCSWRNNASLLEEES